MPMICEICGCVQEAGEAALLNEHEHLHVCSTCIMDRQHSELFLQKEIEPFLKN